MAKVMLFIAASDVEAVFEGQPLKKEPVEYPAPGTADLPEDAVDASEERDDA